MDQEFHHCAKRRSDQAVLGCGWSCPRSLRSLFVDFDERLVAARLCKELACTSSNLFLMLAGLSPTHELVRPRLRSLCSLITHSEHIYCSTCMRL